MAIVAAAAAALLQRRVDRDLRWGLFRVFVSSLFLSSLAVSFKSASATERPRRLRSAPRQTPAPLPLFPSLPLVLALRLLPHPLPPPLPSLSGRARGRAAGRTRRGARRCPCLRCGCPARLPRLPSTSPPPPPPPPPPPQREGRGRAAGRAPRRRRRWRRSCRAGGRAA